MCVVCEKYGIIVIGYMLFVVGKVLKDEIIIVIVDKYGVSIVEVVVVWELVYGLVIILLLIKCKNLEINFKVFEFILSVDDIVKIDVLDCGDC